MEDPEDGAWRIESLSRLYELYHDAVLFTMGAHGEKSMCKVIRIAGQPIYKLYLEGIKEPIPTSETHLNPVVGHGLVPSYKLAPGDKLISRGEDGKGTEVAITSISIEPAPEYVYCLEMITVPQEAALFTFVVPFLMSTVCGTIMAAVILGVLYRSKAVNVIRSALGENEKNK